MAPETPKLLPPLHEVRNPVVLFNNGIGDHLINLPALRALASLLADRLTLVAAEGTGELFFSDLPLRTLVEVPFWVEDGRRQFPARDVAQAVGECDLFMSLTPWHSESMTRLLAHLKPGVSIGFFRQFDITLARDYGKHSADLAFDIPRYLDAALRLEDYAQPSAFPPAAARLARQVRAELPPNTRVLAVHADSTPEKMWPAGKFVDVLDAFLGRRRDFVALVVGRTYQPLDAGRYGHRVVPCYGLSLGASLCLVAEAQLFLGVDSCMLHVADLFRLPGVGLFGPAFDSAEFGFRLGPHRVVCASDSMEAIEVADVVDALEDLLTLRGAK